jgi:hypothetical protein
VPRSVGRARSLTPLVVAVACAPIAVLAIVRVVSGWVPMGDQAVISHWTRQVFTTDTPLLGMPSTAGTGSANHPGPLLYWVLAPWDLVAGGDGWAHPVAIAVLACACVTAVAWAAHRVAGTGAAVGAVAVTSLVGASLGRWDVLDHWNPHAATLPFVAALFVGWAVAAGRTELLPVLAFLASFVAQAHVVYLPFLALLVGVGVVGVALGPRGPRPIVLAGVVLLVVWAPPLWEQVTGDPGNVSEVLDAASSGGEPGVGAAWAVRAVGEAIGVVPSFVVPARWNNAFDPAIGLGTAVTALVVVGALVVLGEGARRRRDRPAVAAASLALGAQLVAVVVVSRLPLFLGVVMPGWRLLFLWGIGAFTWFALGFVVARATAPSVGRTLAGAAAAVVVVGAAVLPFTASAQEPPRDTNAALRALAPEVAAELEGDGPVELVVAAELPIDLQYGLFDQLERRGVDVRIDPADPQFGHRYPADATLPRLVVLDDPDADAPSQGRLVARWPADPDPPVVRAYLVEASPGP